ncbi:hypothetical protein BVG19_g4907 [[Candida] boidinii]|nr:hypothetical protein BVG19_g4907 [[Candida] boidinii]OWB53523.1 hypothetical protein B5S27_g5123 [[Candida] boidinii]
MTSTNLEIESTPVSKHNPNLTHAATVQPSRHVIDPQQRDKTSNNHEHNSTPQSTSPNKSCPPASLPAKGSWASVAGAGLVTKPKTCATVPEDAYYSAMKTPIQYQLKSQIAIFRNQLNKTTVSSVDGKPIDIEHLKSCLRQLEEKARFTPELETRIINYNNYLLDTFQDIHGVYHQAFVPTPTFNEDDLKITNDCYKRFEIMLIEHFESQYDYNLHLPSTHPNQRLVIIQATCPVAAYPDRELIYDKHLQEYGKLVLTHTEDIDDKSLKSYYDTFFVLNYTSTSLPPSTVPNYTEPSDSYTKIRFTLRTQMTLCLL